MHNTELDSLFNKLISNADRDSDLISDESFQIAKQSILNLNPDIYTAAFCGIIASMFEALLLFDDSQSLLEEALERNKQQHLR